MGFVSQRHANDTMMLCTGALQHTRHIFEVVLDEYVTGVTRTAPAFLIDCVWQNGDMLHLLRADGPERQDLERHEKLH